MLRVTVPHPHCIPFDTRQRRGEPLPPTNVYEADERPALRPVPVYDRAFSGFKELIDRDLQGHPELRVDADDTDDKCALCLNGGARRFRFCSQKECRLRVHPECYVDNLLFSDSQPANLRCWARCTGGKLPASLEHLRLVYQQQLREVRAARLPPQRVLAPSPPTLANYTDQCGANACLPGHLAPCRQCRRTVRLLSRTSVSLMSF